MNTPIGKSFIYGMEYNSYILWHCPKWLLYPAIVYLTITYFIPVLLLWFDPWQVVRLWFWLYLIGGGILWLGIVPLVTLIFKSR